MTTEGRRKSLVSFVAHSFKHLRFISRCLFSLRDSKVSLLRCCCRSEVGTSLLAVSIRNSAAASRLGVEQCLSCMQCHLFSFSCPVRTEAVTLWKVFKSQWLLVFSLNFFRDVIVWVSWHKIHQIVLLWDWSKRWTTPTRWIETWGKRGCVYSESRGKRSVWEEVATLLGLLSPRTEDSFVFVWFFFFFLPSSELCHWNYPQIFVAPRTILLSVNRCICNHQCENASRLNITIITVAVICNCIIINEFQKVWLSLRILWQPKNIVWNSFHICHLWSRALKLWDVHYILIQTE